MLIEKRTQMIFSICVRFSLWIFLILYQIQKDNRNHCKERSGTHLPSEVSAPASTVHSTLCDSRYWCKVLHITHNRKMQTSISQLVRHRQKHIQTAAFTVHPAPVAAWSLFSDVRDSLQFILNIFGSHNFLYRTFYIQSGGIMACVRLICHRMYLTIHQKFVII